MFFKPNPKPVKEHIKKPSAAWRRRVIELFTRDNYTCQNPSCKHKVVYKKDNHRLHPHHIDYGSGKKDDSLKNLLTLCYECHRLLHDGHIEDIWRHRI